MTSKAELEFHDPLTSGGADWHEAPGDVTGELRELILSGDPGTGNFTRLLRFPAGADTSPNGVLSHDVWEEVWIIEGTLRDLRLGQTFSSGMYACRPPGMRHGPWVSEDGALTFEIRYTDDGRPAC